MTQPKRFTVAELEEAKAWDLPFVETPETPVEQQKTNALNRRSDWKYEPPEEPEEIKPPTAEEIEAIRQAAYEEGLAQGKQTGYEEGKTQGFDEGKTEGFAAGFDEGKAQGLEAGTTTVNQQAQLWQQLADGLSTPLEQVNKDVRQEIVKLAVALSRSVIRTEVKTNQDVILQALSEGLKVLPVEENHYQIHLHPDDIEFVKAHFGEDTIAEHKWQLVATPGLAKGGCDITTKTNAVDVSIERRCRAVLDKFLLDQGLSDDL